MSETPVINYAKLSPQSTKRIGIHYKAKLEGPNPSPQLSSSRSGVPSKHVSSGIPSGKFQRQSKPPSSCVSSALNSIGSKASPKVMAQLNLTPSPLNSYHASADSSKSFKTRRVKKNDSALIEPAKVKSPKNNIKHVPSLDNIEHSKS